MRLSAKKVQFIIATIMTKSIREILSPLLITSYVCGIRVVEFPVDNLRQWFSFLYLLLLWVLYNFITIYIISYTANYTIEYHICIGLHTITALISIATGIYYDKIFKNCIIVDDTLEKLGITTNYYKWKMKIVCLTLGWSVIIILLTYLESQFLKGHMGILQAIVIPSTRNYCIYINFIADLIIIIILRYIELKFDQINKYFEKLSKDNKRRIKLTWKCSMLCSYKSRFPKTSRNKCLTKCNKIWIAMHLHSELRRISREINSIFRIQMTLEMGCFITFIATIAREIIHMMYNKNYTNNNMFYSIILVFWIFLYFFRLILINYVCERVSTKANATGNFINRIPTCNVESRENFLLQTAQSPLRFYGLGLFQFGFKFIFGFLASTMTILVIYIQAFFMQPINI